MFLIEIELRHFSPLSSLSLHPSPNPSHVCAHTLKLRDSFLESCSYRYVCTNISLDFFSTFIFICGAWGKAVFMIQGQFIFSPFYIKNSTSERLNSKAELSVFPATSQPSKAVPEPVYLLLLWLLVNVDSLSTCVWGQPTLLPSFLGSPSMNSLGTCVGGQASCSLLLPRLPIIDSLDTCVWGQVISFLPLPRLSIHFSSHFSCSPLFVSD